MAKLKLIGSRFLKLVAERKPEFSGKLEMKTNIKINSLEKVKDAKDTLKLTYSFEVDYVELGGVTIDGALFLSGDAKSIKEMLKMQKNKNYESQEYMGLTNLIIQKASIKAFELEEELGLPIHIKLPTISIKN